MIRAILYDLDGVLVDACKWHYNALNGALVTVGAFPITEKQHEATYNGLPTKRKLEILMENGLLSEKQADAVWKIKQKMTITVIEQNAVPHLEKIELHEFTKQHRIMSACVTNSIRETATAMLSRTWQLDYMTSLVCNEDVAKNKPHPDCYLLAMKRLAVYPHEALIVEDSDVGFAAASATGAKVVRVKDCHEVNIGSAKYWLNL